MGIPFFLRVITAVVQNSHGARNSMNLQLTSFLDGRAVQYNRTVMNGFESDSSLNLFFRLSLHLPLKVSHKFCDADYGT